MKKEKTAFGKFYSTLRKKHGQNIKDAALILNVSIGYISRVEYGEKEIPKHWIDIIIESYNLSIEEINALNDSIKNTPSTRRISIKDIEDSQINLIMNIISDPKERDELIKLTKERLSQFRK